MTDNPNATWAKFYVVRRRWKLTPIHVIVNGRCSCMRETCDESNWGKHPVMRDWNNPTQMIKSEADVDRWWPGTPGSIPYSLGLPTGEVNNILIVDVDPRNGGFESLREFESQVEPLPYTLTSATGGGGLHYFFKYPAGTTIKSRALHTDLPGLDIKTNGGQIVMPPSLHRSGKRYAWAEGRTGSESIAPLPDKIREAFEKIQRGTGGGAEWAGERVDIERWFREGIPEGNRNATLHKAAVSIARRERLESAKDSGKLLIIQATVEALNARACIPPLPQSEIDKLVKSACEFVINTPSEDLRSDPALGSYIAAKRHEAVTGLPAAMPPLGPETPAGPPAPMVRVSPPSPMTGVVRPAVEADPDAVETGGWIDRFTDHDGEEAEAELGRLPEEDDGDAEGTHGDADGPEHWRTAHGVGGDIDDAFYPVNPPDEFIRTLSDLGNGRRLIDYFGRDLRYTPGQGWTHWAGDRTGWRMDSASLTVTERAKAVTALIATESSYFADADKRGQIAKWSKDSRSNGRIQAMIQMAHSDPRSLVAVEEWDGSKDLLGTKNGVIDLRTGELYAHSHDVYIRNHVAVEYTPYWSSTRDPRFETFLAQATGGDKDMEAWLQRAAGYTLTGHTAEQVFFLLYGPPGSGKGTFIDIIAAALGEYAHTLERDAITEGRGSRGGNGGSSLHEYTAAAIAGKRMLVVSELPEAERMKEAAVKALSGEDSIRGRHLREEEFTFRPNAKLWIGTNHRPIIEDQGIWRRMKAIPFTYRPPVRDRTLKPYLLDPDGGLPAVMAWAVEGAVEWYKLRDSSAGGSGLGSCKVIEDAVAEYQESEDRLGQFLADECERVPGAAVPMQAVWVRSNDYFRQRGEAEIKMIRLIGKLRERGETVTGSGKTAMLEGWSMKPEAGGRFASLLGRI